MSKTEFVELLCESLEVESGTLSLETEIASVPEWTSVGWLVIMSALDEQLGIQLSSKDIRSFKTVQDVVDYAAAKAPLE